AAQEQEVSALSRTRYHSRPAGQVEGRTLFQVGEYTGLRTRVGPFHRLTGGFLCCGQKISGSSEGIPVRRRWRGCWPTTDTGYIPSLWSRGREWPVKRHWKGWGWPTAPFCPYPPWTGRGG